MERERERGGETDSDRERVWFRLRKYGKYSTAVKPPALAKLYGYPIGVGRRT